MAKWAKPSKPYMRFFYIIHYYLIYHYYYSFCKSSEIVRFLPCAGPEKVYNETVIHRNWGSGTPNEK